MSTSGQDPLQTLAERNPAPLDSVESNFSEVDRAQLLGRARVAARSKGGGWRLGFTRLPWPARGAVAAALIAAVGAYLVLGGGSAKSPSVGPQFADAAVRVAEVNPRILVTEPGWTITHVEPLQTNTGETRFSDGTSALDITWYPARFYDSYREDRARESGPDIATEVLGLEGTTVHYGGSDYATMLPPQGDIFIEIRGDLGSKDAYDEILGSLETTSVDTWLGAMPADVVRPDQQPQLVDDLLKGVPLPPEFDLQKLEGEAVLNPDGIRYKVADQVACGWLDSWAAAHVGGEKAAMAAAVTAMSSAKDWPVLQERPTNGSTRTNILELARQISDGRLDTSFGGAKAIEDGKTYEYGPAYALQLGCDSVTRRETNKPFG